MPRSVPLQDIVQLKTIAAKVRNIVDKHIAHLDRKRRKRFSSWDDVYAALGKQVALAAKYGDLVGRQVADDLDNFVIPRDWMMVFDHPWRGAPNTSTGERGRAV